MSTSPLRRLTVLGGSAALLAGCALPAAPATSTSPERPAGSSPSVPASRSAHGTAADVLAHLPVKGRAPMTGYDRAMFGQAWLDADRNGCDTRDDMLARDLRHVVDRPGSDCVVQSGDLADPYTGARIHFVKGDGSLVDIDHVVALGDAWVTGAFRWDVKQRAALANDPMNLLAVDAGANRAKGDGDAATWLPPRKTYRCTYVARQVAVKAKYGLWVTPAERAAMDRVLSGCPGQPPAPDSGAPRLVPVNVPTPSEQTSPATPSRGGGRTYYADCDAARRAGATPLRRGEPGYRSSLDGDGDGTACE